MWSCVHAFCISCKENMSISKNKFDNLIGKCYIQQNIEKGHTTLLFYHFVLIIIYGFAKFRTFQKSHPFHFVCFLLQSQPKKKTPPWRWDPLKPCRSKDCPQIPRFLQSRVKIRSETSPLDFRKKNGHCPRFFPWRNVSRQQKPGRHGGLDPS